jgi:ribosomal protein L28
METSLTRLQHSFATWRSSSSTKRRSNANLRTQAVTCLKDHRYSEVSAAIGVSVNTLRSWQKSLRGDPKILDHHTAFVAINLDHMQDIEKQNSAQLQLKATLPSGITIHVQAPDVRASIDFMLTLHKRISSCSI